MKNKYIMIIFILLLISTFYLIQNNKNKKTDTDKFYKNITSEEAYNLIKDKNLIIIDFRTFEEYNLVHINNSILINFYNPNLGKELILFDKNKEYLIYCKSGHRSNLILKFMKKEGFKKIYNLEKGIDDWIKLRFSVIRNNIS